MSAHRSGGAVNFSASAVREQDADQQIRALWKLTVRLSAAASQGDVCAAIADHAMETLGARSGGVFLLNAAGTSLERCSRFGPMDADAVAQSDGIPITSDAVPARALRERGSLFLDTEVALLLTSGGRTIGVMALTFATPMFFSPRTRMFMESVAYECARALDRAMLYEREKQARADAELASHAKDDFLATLSHELRTPLNAILGWAKLLSENVLPAAAMPHALETILRNARHQARLVDDLLDLSRITTGQMRLDMQDVQLRLLICQVMEAVQPMADAKRITLRRHVECDLETVRADPDRLRQIIWNLLTNAIKFTNPDGAVDIHLTRDLSHAMIRVTDNGDGIAADLLPFVFDRFRQGDSSLHRQHPGLGLGLAISRHLAELHGGSVIAFSAGPGKGAMFTLLLPLEGIGLTKGAEHAARTGDGDSPVLPGAPDCGGRATEASTPYRPRE